MKANRRFFIFTFILNMILGAAEGGIFWLIWVIGSSSGLKYLISLGICAVVFIAMSVMLNRSIVKRSKLKTAYFIYGTAVNVLFFALVSVILPFCFGFTLVI